MLIDTTTNVFMFMFSYIFLLQADRSGPTQMCPKTFKKVHYILDGLIAPSHTYFKNAVETPESPCTRG